MSRIHNVELDEVAIQRLICIARRHYKLVLEFGGRRTSPKRREAIKAEITALREQRSQIINSCTVKMEDDITCRS